MNGEGKSGTKSNTTLIVVIVAVVLFVLLGLVCGLGAVGALFWTVRSEPEFVQPAMDFDDSSSATSDEPIVPADAPPSD